MASFEGVRVALIHDWLTGMRGGERVLEEICRLVPHADLFTLLHVPGSTSPVIEGMEIRTSWIQRLPFTPAKFRSYLALFPAAIESLDLRGYDLVISTSHCVAKGVIPDPAAVHVSYVFTPMRYAWDLQHEYLDPRRASRLVRLIAPVLASPLRTWDSASANRVDEFVACSRHVARRIARFYRRDADVIYPPVETERFTPGDGPRRHLLVVSALVAYKAIDHAVDAARTTGLELIVVGAGPERARLEADAPANVRFVGSVDSDELVRLYRTATAFLLPGEEDCGIAALEAQACGTPVVAYARGGALETVRDGITGCLYTDSSADGLVKAIDRCRRTPFNKGDLREHALGFSRERFREAIRTRLETALADNST